jgi:hypothetical protein
MHHLQLSSPLQQVVSLEDHGLVTINGAPQELAGCRLETHQHITHLVCLPIVAISTVLEFALLVTGPHG